MGNYLRAVAACSLLLSGCGFSGKSISYRYRLTVEVETPAGLKTGSGVIEVAHVESHGLEGSHVDTRVTGEAVPVDLPGGQTLFVLLDQAGNVARKAIDAQLPELPNTVDWWYQDGLRMKAQTGVYELPRMGKSSFPARGMVSNWPTLVHFRDIHAPRTVELVDPDNADATLGAGVRIKRITVQITDDGVTSGIEKRLGWFRADSIRSLDENFTSTTNPTLAQKLGSNDFGTGPKGVLK